MNIQVAVSWAMTPYSVAVG